MRLVVVVLLLSSRLVAVEDRFHFPSTGNEVLAACALLVNLEDQRGAIASLPDAEFNKVMGQIDWCAGYLDAFHEQVDLADLNLGLIGMMGVTLAGPDKLRSAAFRLLDPVCIPQNSPLVQLARVLVKWLREHPERLHENRGVLVEAAFRDSFPCPNPDTK